MWVALGANLENGSNANTKVVCLHSAFQFPGVGAEEVRESFEIRALVFDSMQE